MNSIFEYSDYKAYLRDWLERPGGSSRGERTRLAEAVRCHNGYVSQVLNGAAHFSLEQAEAINHHLGHGKDQGGYFLLLVQAARAGTPGLRAHFTEQMKALVEKQFVLKDRLKFQKTLTREDQATFYSSWHYGAIHVLVSVPGCHTEKGISDYLGLPLTKVTAVLDFLTSVGLIARKDGRYEIGARHIHLENDSPMISKHHTNWRLQAIHSLDRARQGDLHYSSVITASHEDSVRIREILVRAIEEVRGVVRQSRDEGAFSYAIDFFGLSAKE